MIYKIIGVFLALLVLNGCSVKVPDDITLVKNFDVTRYQGTWYEIARFDHSFERGLEQVTATYRLNQDDSLNVINRGFNFEKGEWSEVEGKGYFIGRPDVAALKVSFFGPFYGGYNVIALDSDYRYALVTGENKNYLWILSRTKTLPESVKARYLAIAEQNGFDTRELIWVRH